MCACNRILSARSRTTHIDHCIRTTNTDSLILPSLDEVLSLDKPTLKHVPGYARQNWARCLQAALHDAAVTRSTESVLKLLMLPKCVLPSKKRGGKGERNHVDINKLCQRWLEGECIELWHEARRHQRPRTAYKKTKSEGLTAQAAIAFAEEGLYSKASRVLSSKGIAPNHETTRQLLEDKHPSISTTYTARLHRTAFAVRTTN